jgi:hypothetical protein
MDRNEQPALVETFEQEYLEWLNEGYNIAMEGGAAEPAADELPDCTLYQCNFGLVRVHDLVPNHTLFFGNNGFMVLHSVVDSCSDA